MKFVNCSCFHIFIDQDRFEPFKGDGNSQQNFIDFSRVAVSKVEDNDSTQEYIFSDTSTVKSEFEKYKADPATWTQFCERLSSILLHSQQNSQKIVDHLGKKVTPGSLLLAHGRTDGANVDILVLIKMEQEEFANVVNFKPEYGLPFEKKALNTAFITFEANGKASLLISRTNAFWVNFLEAMPIRAHNVNTANAFNSMDKVLVQQVKRKGYKADYLALKNHLLTYMRNNAGQIVSFKDLVDVVFVNHVPHDAGLDVGKLTQKVLALPTQQKGGFDNQFRIDMTDVKAKRRTTQIPLTDKIELSLKDGIADLNQTIKPYDDDGRKGIIIYTDEGFEHFKE